MTARTVRPPSASVGAETAGTRPDYCNCEWPILDPADPEEFCWKCLRDIDEDRGLDAFHVTEVRRGN